MCERKRVRDQILVTPSAKVFADSLMRQDSPDFGQAVAKLMHYTKAYLKKIEPNHPLTRGWQMYLCKGDYGFVEDESEGENVEEEDFIRHMEELEPARSAGSNSSPKKRRKKKQA